MNICVCCSSKEVSEKYMEPVRELGKRIAEGGHNLVWGGSNRGMMKVIADAVQENGGKLIGVSFELLRERARKEATEMIVEKDLNTRKATLLARSDAIVMLPGGTGTLDEITEVIELKVFEMHNKAIIALNTNDFYAGLKTQLERMHEEDFLHVPLVELIHFADTPNEVIEYITNYVPPLRRGKF
ncbi:TIGR00730 family Rossman fold protein [Candidatus Kaiserbacteria bacterium]|nr:TIGR00730 family Rossman fold protein [Candidatus Kaiserbacteria bacterium]